MTAPDLSAIRAQYEGAPRLLVSEATPLYPASVYEEEDGLDTLCVIPDYYALETQNALAHRIAAAPSTVERLLGIVERVEAVLDAIETHSSLDSNTVEYRTLDGWVDVEDALRTALTGEGA